MGETAAASSRTWRFDPDSGRIGGWIDGEEALRQAVLLRLLTPRYEHMIYSFGYGSELAGLIGKDGGYVQAAVPAMVEEALLRDERILAVRDEMCIRDRDSGFRKALEEFFSREMRGRVKNLCKEAVNKGIAWLQVYPDGERLGCRKIPSEQVIPLWQDGELSLIHIFFDFFTGLDQVLRLAADFFIDFFTGAFLVPISAVQQGNPHGNCADVQIFLLNHGDGFHDIVYVDQS